MAISLNHQYNRNVTQLSILPASENYGNEFLAFKKYIMWELNDLKKRLEVLNNLGNTSYSHETTAILKEEIDFIYERIIKIKAF